MAPHWLDDMPAIPLARSVPVVLLADASRQRGRMSMCVKGARGVVTFVRNGIATVDVRGETCTMRVALLRVDLDDPQGFAYALRHCIASEGDDADEDPAMDWLSDMYCDDTAPAGLVFRHLIGTTTDADRLALAQALAEVSHV